MQPLLLQAQYNRWANLELLRAASSLPEGAFTRVLGGSFPSIHEAFVHILWAESLWLARWRGASFAPHLTSAAFPTTELLRTALEAIHAEQMAFLSALPDPVPQSPISYVNFRGETWSYPLPHMVQHLVVHSAFHRGQVASMLRQLGLAPPHTDFLVFIDTLTESSV